MNPFLENVKSFFRYDFFLNRSYFPRILIAGLVNPMTRTGPTRKLSIHFTKKLKATVTYRLAETADSIDRFAIRFQFATLNANLLILLGIRIQSHLDNDKIIDCNGTCAASTTE